MVKKYFFISFSVIFILASAAGIGWIIKKEMEKTKTGQKQIEKSAQNQEVAKRNSSSETGEISGEEEQVTVGTKSEANKAVEDMDAIVNSMGSDLSK